MDQTEKDILHLEYLNIFCILVHSNNGVSMLRERPRKEVETMAGADRHRIWIVSMIGTLYSSSKVNLSLRGIKDIHKFNSFHECTKNLRNLSFFLLDSKKFEWKLVENILRTKCTP